MKEGKLTYTAVYQELDEIAKEIEKDTITVDLLNKKVARASKQVSFCQAKLKATKTEVNKIIKQMEQKTGEELDLSKKLYTFGKPKNALIVAQINVKASIV